MLLVVARDVVVAHRRRWDRAGEQGLRRLLLLLRRRVRADEPLGARLQDENAFLESHGWDEYAEWHLGLTDGATDETKARYAFVFGDFRRIHRTGIIACHFRAAEWRHKEIELAAHELLQYLDRKTR